MEKRKTVLLFTDWYEPGYKAGGPIQSCKNLVAQLKEDYRFYVVTSDRDINETEPYKNIERDKWLTKDHETHLWYASPGYLSSDKLKSIIDRVAPDIIYLNSMFSKKFTLQPLFVLKKMKFAGRVILAPRGMLHTGALSQKKLKKRMFLGMFRLSGWHKKIVFHATDEQEFKNIKRVFPGANAVLASNIPNISNSRPIPIEKVGGELKSVFISRIHPHKNLHFFLDVLKNVPENLKIQLDVYGTADDQAYIRQCNNIAIRLPSNISVNFLPSLPNSKVFETIGAYHVFILPTLGENFGHAIFESFEAGRPVIISDQTPWRSLPELKAGWDCSLVNMQLFVDAVTGFAEMKQQEFDQWTEGAKSYARSFLSSQDYSKTYSNLFNGTGN